MYSQIICIDDDPITLLLSRKVMMKMETSIPVQTFEAGAQALDYLHNQPTKSDPPAHILILLDLNMPVMGGWEFLDAFSVAFGPPNTHHIDVVILSSTIDPQDVERAQRYTVVRSFVSKPITKELMRHLLSKTG